MMDLVRKNGDTIDIKKLGEAIGCKIIEISALKGEGIEKAAALAVSEAKSAVKAAPAEVFDGKVEEGLQTAHLDL